MKYKSIFIANFTEVAVPLLKVMTKDKAEEETFEDHALCDRFLLSGEDDRVLVTPFPIDKDFYKDTCELLNIKNTTNFFLDDCSESICESIIADKSLTSLLENIIKQNPGILVNSYAGTEQFINLVKKWRNRGLIFKTPEIPTEKDEWTQTFFGSKAGFRQAAANLGPNFPQMPDGAICNSAEELLGWAKYLINKGSGCVLKYNRGLAGAGLRIVKPGDDLEGIIKSEKYFSQWPVVVEEYINTDLNVCGGAPNIELHTVGDKAEALYTCAMRVTPEGVFMGIEIGTGAVAEKLDKLLRLWGEKWGNYLVKHGYRGYFEIDFVAGNDSKIYPIEANLRRTGGTHVFETANKLLREKWKENYIVARNITDTKFSNYLELKKATKHLFFQNGEGVIITVAKYLDKNKFGYIVIGKNKKRALEIEKKFLALC